MRSIFAAGLVAGLALASPVLAQNADAPAKAYDATTVLATVNGTTITLGNVITHDTRTGEYIERVST